MSNLLFVLSSIPGSGIIGLFLREAVWQQSEPSIGVSTAQCQSSNKPIILGLFPNPSIFFYDFLQLYKIKKSEKEKVKMGIKPQNEFLQLYKIKKGAKPSRRCEDRSFVAFFFSYDIDS